MQIINGAKLATVTDDKVLGFFGPYRFLSNFHRCPVELDGIVYPSSEHAYMACKSVSLEERRRIAGLTNPAEAKRYGRTMTISAEDWDTQRLAAMLRVLMAKFKDPALRQELLATGNRYLEETNNWGDRYWGVDGTGLNHLGKLLMMLRDTYRLQPQPPAEAQLKLL